MRKDTTKPSSANGSRRRSERGKEPVKRLARIPIVRLARIPIVRIPRIPRYGLPLGTLSTEATMGLLGRIEKLERKRKGQDIIQILNKEEADMFTKEHPEYQGLIIVVASHTNV